MTEKKAFSWIKSSVKVFSFLVLFGGGWVLSVKGFFILPASVKLPSYLSRIGLPTLDRSFKKEHSEVCVFVINLNKDIDRYRSIQPLVQQLGFTYQRISGVWGSSLSNSFIENFVDKKSYELAFNGATPGFGELGCFLSHVKAWISFLNSNAKFALILEDDAEFDPSKLKQIIQELIRFQNLWDICSLFSPPAFSGSFLSVSEFSFSCMLVQFLEETSGTVGLLINRRAAKSLLSKAEKYVLPVDHYIQRIWEFDDSIRFTGIFPGLIKEKGGTSSIDLQGRRKKSLKILGSKQFQRICSQIFHLKSYFAYYCYNYYLALISKFHKKNYSLKIKNDKELLQ
ncbi:glycosyltransferase family 25 protein [Holospora undulata]|uniref:Procollagen galactosyltransferase 1-A n=1 Tax=Holospora undulata HU1 TaxID=1321371 RepID=A0A061JH27_9PROT|nr:glycosyltransferase family 25 protein [Holospora undulata]ETZ05476.1 procollagen galactosyltransferase 1-A [Holospora undulata HU1]